MVYVACSAAGGPRREIGVQFPPSSARRMRWWMMMLVYWYKTYIISAQRPALAGPRRWIIKLIIYTAGTPPAYRSSNRPCCDGTCCKYVDHIWMKVNFRYDLQFKPMTDEWYPTDVFKPWQNLRITIVCLGGYHNGSYVVHTCAYNNSLLWLCGGMWYSEPLK